MPRPRRTVLLVQLPIPRPGLEPVQANVPLAAGFLKLFADRHGLAESYDIQILPQSLASSLGDQGIVDALLARQPFLVGFTCYLWNVDRTLWVADRLKQLAPGVKILLGGPEITADNGWVLAHPAIDYAALGEGEQTFAELLAALHHSTEHIECDRLQRPASTIAGLAVLPGPTPQSPRAPLQSLDAVGSPYRQGMIDLGPERTMFLETARGCACRCKFCYYPKSYRAQHFLSPEQILADLQFAIDQGAEEVFLLDPTLNQRPDFAGFLRLLARGNPGRRLRLSGELRAELLRPHEARLLADAGFTELEIGLQSTDPTAQRLMGRSIDLQAFARGARALAGEGIRLRTDLILGLPGDTVDSVRRSIDFLLTTQSFTEAQVFHLSILPGTAFRQESSQLGLVYQQRPPYGVLHTPTLSLDEIVALMDEAQDALGVDFDPVSAPQLNVPPSHDGLVRLVKIDLDTKTCSLPPVQVCAQAMVLWFVARDFLPRRSLAATLIRQLLDENPHTSLDVVIEPTVERPLVPASILEDLLAACHPSTSYLDRYYSLSGQRRGAKRLVVLLPSTQRERLGQAWITEVAPYATIAWRGGLSAPSQLQPHEYLVE